MGMSCTHCIQKWLTENGVLMIDDIYPYWHFLPRTTAIVIPLVLEPVVANVCGRPQKTQPNHTTRAYYAASSTHRLPSTFEWITSSIAIPTRRSARSYLNKNREVEYHVHN
jgi:hypothetical protein